MEILKKLSPAETYLIIEDNTVSLKNLLKYTLVDLILKKVLILKEEQFQPAEKDPIQTIVYIKAGENFKSHKAKAHEHIFLQTLSVNEELEITFRHFIGVVYENVASKRKYIYKAVRKNPITETCISNGFIGRLFGMKILTKKGHAVKKEIQRAISELEEGLPKLVANSSDQLESLLSEIGGNVLLLKSFDLSLLKEIDSQFNKHSQKGTSDIDGCSGCFVFFDFYMDAFDTEFDGFDASSGSSWGDSDGGCSSDSGCSGCSGCGGCGGCGGCS